MSALSVGASAVTVGDQAAASTANPGPGGKFTKWIPGDAIAFYTAILVVDGTAGTVSSAVTGASDEKKLTDAEKLALLRQVDVSAAGWFWFALAVALALVALGALGQLKRARDVSARAGLASSAENVAILDVAKRCLLTGVAFTLWASLLPASWPNNWHVVQDMGSAYTLVVGALAAVFTLAAEWLAPSFQVGAPSGGPQDPPDGQGGAAKQGAAKKGAAKQAKARKRGATR